MTIGVLAVQGDFREHIAILSKFPVFIKQVRTKKDLTDCDGLIIPGGESTTISKLLKQEGIDNELQKTKLPIFGTCAGAILLAKDLTSKEKHSLGLMDITLSRNYYGSQLDSFVKPVLFLNKKISGAFIRAPKIETVGSTIQVLGTLDEKTPVVVQQNQYLAACFHPELVGETKVHEYFLGMVKEFRK
ncbi:pyridoxal 5'-phosphate synthase glutaminase subunit PdxT [Candidatus Woesearchaeota archaeon]|nr:pyridoxal 5'-phosphate synthase glutaminase subunit PdxT [Candidatus Woesearchaeota archaeon]